MYSIYNKKYYKRYLAYKGTKVEQALNKFRTRQTLELISKLPEQEFLIVDYGCSYGSYLKALKEDTQIKNFIGVDINEYCVAHASLDGLTAINSEMFEYFFEKESTPLVMTFWDVLEHLEDPRVFIKRWNPIAILASMPCLDGFKEAFPDKNIELWKHYRPKEHLWHFTVSDFKELMESLGYEVVMETFEESQYRVDPILGDKNIMTFGCIKKG